MHYITGIVGLGIFVYIVYALTHVEIPKENKELWVHLIGITEGIVIGIYAYHYGSKAKKD
jgi:xanthosine utilization system XapX-like protein